MCGWARIQYLSEFKWLTQNEIKKTDGNTVQEDDANGFMSEVDLNYPE